MRILHLTDAKTWYGGEIQLAELLHNLAGIGVKSSVFCYENTPIHQYCQRHNISCFPQKKGLFLLMRNLKKVIQNNQIEVVHIHTSKFLTLFVLTDFFYLGGVSAVYSKKSISMGGGRFLSSRFKYGWHSVKKIIAVSKAIAQSLKTSILPKDYHKIEVIYDGIPLRVSPAKYSIREKYDIQSQYIVMSVANHTIHKDLKTTVLTMDYIVNTLGFKDIHLLQMGRFTPLTQELVHLIEVCNLKSYITLAGAVDDAKQFIGQADVFLITSGNEGGPLTVYEAFVQKTPVVSTEVGVIPEVIESGVNGFISAKKDVVSLAEQVLSVLKNKSLQNKFVELSYSKVIQQFDSRMSAQKTFDIYRSVISQNEK